ncbi:MAG: hypothetical protein N4A68_11935 [Maledivibacter sp.]|jgi:hypothetical protein|nr:hypothetical protein [Maledivibacter sp.]
MNYLVGHGKSKIKKIGEVYVNQMIDEGSNKWLLPRIPPKCEMCNSNEIYNIIRISKPFIFVIPIYDNIYKIVCPECGEAIELELEEYIPLKKLMKENKNELTKQG